jgi:hypothetical protein
VPSLKRCPCRPTCRGSSPSMACIMGRADLTHPYAGRVVLGPGQIVSCLVPTVWPNPFGHLYRKDFALGPESERTGETNRNTSYWPRHPDPSTCRLPAWPRRLAQSRSRAVHPVRARRAAPRILTPYGTRHHTAPLNQPTPREATGARGPHAPPARSAVRSHPTRHALHARVDWFASTAAPRRFASPSPAAAAFIPPCCAFASARAPPAPTRKRNTNRAKKQFPNPPGRRSVRPLRIRRRIPLDRGEFAATPGQIRPASTRNRDWRCGFRLLIPLSLRGFFFPGGRRLLVPRAEGPENSAASRLRACDSFVQGRVVSDPHRIGRRSDEAAGGGRGPGHGRVRAGGQPRVHPPEHPGAHGGPGGEQRLRRRQPERALRQPRQLRPRKCRCRSIACLRACCVRIFFSGVSSSWLGDVDFV